MSSAAPNIIGTASPTMAGVRQKTAATRTGVFSDSDITNSWRTHYYPHSNINNWDYIWYNIGNLDFKASNSNSIYGAASIIRPPAIQTMFIIKY